MMEQHTILKPFLYFIIIIFFNNDNMHFQNRIKGAQSFYKFLVGWDVVSRSFETILQSISGRLSERGRKRKI